MEEEILKILQNSIYYAKSDVSVKKPLVSIAKEIASNMEKFIFWLSLNSHIATSYSPMYYLYTGEGEDRHIDFTKEHHLIEIHKDWNDNIKDKL